MKNIHLIPTDKPSRLGYLTKKGKEVFRDLRLFDRLMPNILDSENQNIYITSDEEIKKKDYVVVSCSEIKIEEVRSIKDYYNEQFLFEDGSQIHIDYCKKIILTTDPDLIKDGIQTIDDEFLEWFVKNPSCEKVEVYEVNGKLFAEPIIPKEEPKQDLEKEIFELEQELDIPSHLRWHNSKPKQDNNFYEKLKFSFSEKLKQYFEETPREKILEDWAKSAEYDNVGPTVDDFLNNTNKQKTLEEASQNYVNSTVNRFHVEQIAFIAGAKWQQEQDKNKCVAGCKNFFGGEVKHHKDCFYYPDSFSKKYDDLKLQQEQMYSEEEMINFAEFVATYTDKNRNVNGEMLHAKSKYDGAERTIDLLEKWFEQFKNIKYETR